jgi:hypothetical protein
MSRQLQLHLEPSRNAERTWFCLTGELSTRTPPRALASLLECLTRISDEPVEFVLPVVYPDGQWFDTWTDTIAAIPVHLEIRFALEPGPRMRVEP